MKSMTKLFIRARESVVRNTRGQTMTEYALILGAIAIVVFVTYELMGQDINKLVNNVDNLLTTT